MLLYAVQRLGRTDYGRAGAADCRRRANAIMTWFEFTMGNICWLSFLSTENFTFRVVPQRELEDAVLKQES